jgi:starch phosphorylase
MTIGFARRAAAYKRADLVFSSPESLRDIARQAGPLQFVYAGKAHPHDAPAKDLIKRVIAARDTLRDDIPIVYLEEHDMGLAKLLCSGVDLWLNNPQKPLEASGTSGMKAALNGVPSFSVLDGWWPEGWIEGVTGWSIGDSLDEEDDPTREAMSLYSKLSYVILPLFYGSPALYGRVMRSTIAINGAYFTAQRMLQQYSTTAYAVRPVLAAS